MVCRREVRRCTIVYEDNPILMEEKPRLLECAPWGGRFEGIDLTITAGLPEDGSHDEAPISQRGLQTAGR